MEVMKQKAMQQS